MQPVYTIEQSDEFVADVTQIFGDRAIFERAFAGFGFYLQRLPRGDNTWDLTDGGDLRLGRLAAGRLSTGEELPAICFSFELSLGAIPTLRLLRVLRD